MPHQFLIFIFISIATWSTAHAEGGEYGTYYISPSVFYSIDTQERNAKADATNLLIDLRAGLKITDNFYAGFLYAMDNKTVKTSGYALSTDNYDNKYQRTSYGPSLGFFLEHFYMIFSYFLSSAWKIDSVSQGSGTTNSIYIGTGYQFDLGFKFPLWGVQFGPMISYKSYSYPKLTGSSEQTLSPPLKETKLDPSLAIWIFF